MKVRWENGYQIIQLKAKVTTAKTKSGVDNSEQSEVYMIGVTCLLTCLENLYLCFSLVEEKRKEIMVI